MPDFSDAKVGDRVWSSRRGWGRVVHIIHKIGHITNSLPLQCMFEECDSSDTVYAAYLLDGKASRSDLYPELHWDEIRFEEPPRPKRKVTKVVERWVVLRRFGLRSSYLSDVYAEEPDITRNEVARQKITFEFEEEE